jgi:signal recognition particle subunit SRP19
MNPRVEEVSDSGSDSDPPEMDLAEMSSLINAAQRPSAAPIPHEMLQPQAPGTDTSAEQQRSKHYQCLYPVYFDSSRTRAEGRRVGADLAVENPLAREIADAAASLGLRVVFEPGKLHPKNWDNPGRVKVLLKQDGKQLHRHIKNKHHLYIQIARYLQAHPADKTTPFRLPIRGLPMPKELPEPAIPAGWKISKILPLHSPALTGGGISENFLQDMMAEMQGEMGGAGPAVASGGGKAKKDKKKK